MKRFLVLFTVLCTLLCAGVIAAEGAQETAWYEESVQNVISTGILASGSDLFLPEANVTAKDLTAAAARLNNLYKGGSTQLPADYDFATYYTNYISANGLNSGVTVAGEDQEMTRADVVTILYNAIKDYADLTAINSCLDIADCNTAASYYAAALNFTNAGIVAGYDEYGSFMPSNLVKRYELCVMLDRILNVNERVEADYIVYTSDAPLFLIHDDGHGYAASIPFEQSGWRMDYTGSEEIGSRDVYNVKLNDYSTSDDIKLSRKIHVQQDGVLTFDAVYQITSGGDLYFDFLDSDGEQLLRAGWDNGVAFLEGQGSPLVNGVELSSVKEKSSTVSQLNNRVSTKIILNLDEKTAEMWMGTTYCGKVNLKDGFANFAEVEILTGVEEIVLAEIKNVHLYKNYLVNDMFIVEQQGKAPIGYTTSGDVTVAKIDSASVGQGDYNSAKITTTAGKTSYAKKNFKKTGGKVIIEGYMLLDDTANTASDGDTSFTVYSADVPVITVKSTGGAWYSVGNNSNTKLRDIDAEIWQRIRIEADTATQKARIRVNGKLVASEVDFLVKADGFDAIEISHTAATAGVLWFDDIEVYETFDYNASADADNRYVPVPEPLDTGDYMLNMSVCSLWRNGRHYGWDWISSFPELEPALGFYDEGNVEVADWEIKFLTEHGIKNQMLCWYPTKYNAPIKNAPFVYHALHDGYMNAEYSDMMTFSLMFENSGYAAGTLDNFKNYVFPYWMDMYFKDPRYCRITKDDGKEYLFLNVYQWPYWQQMAGGEAESAALVQWMSQQVKDAGIAEGIFFCFGGAVRHNSDQFQQMLNCGAEAVIFYAWNDPSENFELQTEYFAKKAYEAGKAKGMEILALPSAGFNDIGWAQSRTGLMSTADFKKTLEWYRDTYCGSTMLGGTADESFKSKLITFDTWNEYGEGHYMMPTAAEGTYRGQTYGGFGYLDAIAEVFGGVTEAQAGNNDVPEGKGKLRINTLYPNNDQYIRREQLVDSTLDDSLKFYKGFSSFSSKYDAGSRQNIDSYSYDSSAKAISFVSSSSCSVSYPARVKFMESSTSSWGNQTYKFSCSNADYIHLRLKVQDGGDTGKIYFKTSVDNEYDEAKAYRFFTYSDVHDYYFKLDENAEWTGDFMGFMLELSNKASKTAYVYALEFMNVDESKAKTQITIDGVDYQPRDYGEIEPPYADTGVQYTNTRNELYIAPADEQGLLRMLHITREWKRAEGKLLLETPDGTTFEFTVGSNQVKVNNVKTVTLDKKVVLYDGVPVLPLMYILRTAGYDYAYDFDNKKLDIIVAQKYRSVEGIENGDAEDTSNTTAFTGYNNGQADKISIVTDPDNSKNHVWKRSTNTGSQYNYFSVPFDFEAGKTYTLDFDIYFDSVGTEGAAPSTNANIAINPRYYEGGTSIVEHNVNLGNILVHKTWKHITYTFTVNDTYSGGGQMSFYLNPVDSLGCVYLVDNFALRTYPRADLLENGDAEGSNETAFRKNSPSEVVSIKTESDGNRYWDVKSGTSAYTYVIQDVEQGFERGVTYYYKVRVKLGNNANGEAITGSNITLNVRYYDMLKLGLPDEWYAHTYTLSDKNGKVVSFNSGGDWVDCYGSFTISMGYDPANTSITEQITFFCNPQNSLGTDFMFDDFQISTEGPID